MYNNSNYNSNSSSSSSSTGGGGNRNFGRGGRGGRGGGKPWFKNNWYNNKNKNSNNNSNDDESNGGGGGGNNKRPNFNWNKNAKKLYSGNPDLPNGNTDDVELFDDDSSGVLIFDSTAKNEDNVIDSTDDSCSFKMWNIYFPKESN